MYSHTNFYDGGGMTVKVTLIVAGLAVLTIGAILAANSAATLIAAGVLSPLLLSVGGVKFFETLVWPTMWLIGGIVLALIGVGLVIAALNLRRGLPMERSAEK